MVQAAEGGDCGEVQIEEDLGGQLGREHSSGPKAADRLVRRRLVTKKRSDAGQAKPHQAIFPTQSSNIPMILNTPTYATQLKLKIG